MTVINTNSISGISSITTPSGVGNQLTLHTNNTTEAFKLDSAGNLHFHNHLNITGISSASNFKTGTSNLHNTGLNVQDLDVDGHTNLDNVSIAGVTTMTGALTISSTTDQMLNLNSSDNNGTSLAFQRNGSRQGYIGYGGASAGLIIANEYVNGAVAIQGNDGGSTINMLSFATDNKGLATLHGGATIPLDLDVDGHTNLDNVSVAGITTYSKSGSALRLNDGSILRIGNADDDYFLHYDNGGSTAYLSVGTSRALRVTTDDFRVFGASNSEQIIRAQKNSAVQLFYDNSLKFQTDSTGFFSTNYGDYIAVSSNGSLASGRFGYESNYKMYLQNTRGTGTKVIFDNDGKIRSQISDGSSIVDRFEVNASGATVTGRVIPASDSTHDLGTNSVRWRNLYADTLYGDGSNLTGISAGTSLSGSTDNTVCTVTGANAIQGEANLTFNGSTLLVTDASIRISSATPTLDLYDSSANPDYSISNNNGVLRIRDVTNLSNAFLIDTSNITISRHFIPYSTNNYDLGTSSTRWRNVYSQDLQLSNEARKDEGGNDVDGTWGDWTLQEGENDVFMINNRTGKKFAITMREVS